MNPPNSSYFISFQGDTVEVATNLSVQLEAKFLPDYQNPMMACQVSHAKTELHVPGTGISLAIPDGAVPQGKCFEIRVSVSLDDDYPELEDGHTLICPIVRCQPHGIRFLKPVTLTLPCNAVNGVKNDLTIWESKMPGKRKRKKENDIKLRSNIYRYF